MTPEIQRLRRISKVTATLVHDVHDEEQQVLSDTRELVPVPGVDEDEDFDAEGMSTQRQEADAARIGEGAMVAPGGLIRIRPRVPGRRIEPVPIP